jgi:glycosyltransferase involved in cell wall biosynthesis
MLQAVAMTRSRLKKVVAYRVIERRTIRTAAAVHFLNEVEEAESSVHLAPHQQRFVLPNGVDLAISDAVSSSAFRKKHPRIQGRKVLLYVGRLHWSKDLALQLAALRSLLADRSDVHLVFVGPDEGASGSLLQTVEAMDLQEHFLWTGPLPRREVFEALAAADIFTLTSRHEAHSMAMNEALAMGLPVVLTEGVGFDRIVAWGAGLVVPSDAASLAAAWRKLLDGEGTAAAMGEAARRAAEQHLAWLQIARDMYVNYQQALEGPID